MLTSLCENNASHIDAYLLNSELDDLDISDMRDALSKYDLTLISLPIDSKVFTERFPRTQEWSIEMYYRLMMSDLLPYNVDRILYLDVDIIINKSLSEFYNKDFSGKELIVCDDKGGKNTPESYGKKHREMFKTAYKNGHRYFNSGVLLMNMELLRDHYSFNNYLKAMENWSFEMEAPDQDILNWVHWKNVSFTDFQIYDYFAKVAHNNGLTYKDVKDNVAIIHYAGDKPWNFDHIHYDIEKLWDADRC